ncbi:hypothetical protein CACET_c01950 [Clostridium aceticum]|uniref:Uncharacterized protein n=1 Tax=Clostridium aceticum TaxID=84022 RepID=A0A0G3W4W4_9CLOT|nr:hypothetical protein CACET_c01950 [Clostridium aceticum]
MSNALMIIGLCGIVLGFLSPIFRVISKKPRRSKGWMIFFVLSFLIFILGVILGL